MDDYQTRIEAAYIVNCSAQSAYQWLYERRYRDDCDVPPWIVAEDNPEVLEFLLTRRNEPLIDLGIARFGHSNLAIRKVYRRGDIGVRCAALSNAHIGPADIINDGWLKEKDIKNILYNGTRTELESLAKNKYLENDALEQILERRDAFSELSETQYINMLVWLGKNPRMSTKYNRNILDGYAEYTHNRVFSVAWELARYLPTTKANAYALYKLLSGTAVPVSYDNPEEVIARWRLGEKSEHAKHPFGYAYFLRSRLADALDANEKLLNSNDPAMKESFYRRFSPWEFKNWPDFINQEGRFAFQAMVENDALWRNTEIREMLCNLAWDVPDSDMDAPNNYDAVKERKKRQHPEWFKEENAEYSNEPDVAIMRLEKKLDKVAEMIETFQETYSQVNVWATDITEKIEHLLEHKEDNKQKFKELRDELSEVITDKLSGRGRNTVMPIWPWIIIIVLLILILFK